MDLNTGKCVFFHLQDLWWGRRKLSYVWRMPGIGSPFDVDGQSKGPTTKCNYRYGICSNGLCTCDPNNSAQGSTECKLKYEQTYGIWNFDWTGFYSGKYHRPPQIRPQGVGVATAPATSSPQKRDPALFHQRLMQTFSKISTGCNSNSNIILSKKCFVSFGGFVEFRPRHLAKLQNNWWLHWILATQYQRLCSPHYWKMQVLCWSDLWGAEWRCPAYTDCARRRLQRKESSKPATIVIVTMEFACARRANSPS